MEYNNVNALLTDLGGDKILPVYIIHGEEAFFAAQVSQYIEHKILAENEKDFNLSVLYGRDVQFKQVVDTTRMYPMMSSRRVVLLKEAQQMKDLDGLLDYIKNPSPHTVFAIFYNGKKMDGRSKLLKTAKKSEVCGVLLTEKIREYKLGQWVDGYLRSRARSITPRANTLLCEYLGNDLKKLTNEINKLELNLPPGKAIDVREIEKFIGISKDFNVFELLGAIGQRDATRAYFVADRLSANFQRNPMQMITPAIFNYFQKVFIVKKSPQTSERQLAGVLRVNPYFVKDYTSAASRFSETRLENIFEWIMETDARTKGVENRKTSQRDLLMELVGKILLN